MASKIFTNIIILAVALALCFSGAPSPVLAASSTEIDLAPFNSTHNSLLLEHNLINANLPTETSFKEMTFKFYLDPMLVPDMDFAKAVLPKYIEDMNSVLTKNTNRRLVFNPEKDIILTNTQPHSNQAHAPFPVENFQIWAYAIPSSYLMSYGGYAGIDDSGAGVLAGLNWKEIYDPGQLTSSELIDYWTQINNMLHELAHVFGAGIGEYYKLSNIKDTTGVYPFLDINVLDPSDVFWADKMDFMADPLLRNPVRTEGLEWLSTREALLAFVKYSSLTAAIMSGDYRNGLPTVDLQNITVSVTTATGNLLAGANVKIWSVAGDNSYQSQLMLDGFTDTNGQITFAWGGSSMPHNCYDFLRLVKVYKNGYVASAKYVSIFDTDITKLVETSDLMDVSVILSSQSALPNPTTLVNSILPTSRTASLGNTVTIFNTVINAGTSVATDITLSVNPAPAGIFSYQQADCATNAIIGSINPILDLVPGGVLCYVLSFTPNETFTATNMHIQAQAGNASSTNLLTGINTWLLRSTAVAEPDIIALTTTADFHQTTCSGVNAFAVAFSNVGAAAIGDITAVANTGSASLPVSISIEETDPGTGTVIGDNILQSVGSGANRTVAVFVTFNGCVNFDAAANRIFIEFRDANNNIVGSTSTAVSTNR